MYRELAKWTFLQGNTKIFFLLTLHQKPDDNYSRLQFSPEMFLQTKISFSPKKLTNSILSHLLFSFIFQMHNQCWFSIWSHIFWGSTAYHLLGRGLLRIKDYSKQTYCVGCGGTWTEECAAQAHAACSEPTWRRRGQQHFVIWWITAWYPL